VYRFFVDQGRPPVAAEVAEALGSDQGAVEEALRRLAAGHVFALAPGTTSIWMANPLSAIPTPFPVEIGGRTWFGNCIWDGLGVIAMLGGTGTVRKRCPDCGVRMSISVGRKRLLRDRDRPAPRQDRGDHQQRQALRAALDSLDVAARGASPPTPRPADGMPGPVSPSL
jgi:hypothetical protein